MHTWFGSRAELRASTRRQARCAALTLLVVGAFAPIAHAKPTAPSALCATYPALPDCTGRVPACSLCHDSTDPPSWNSFGTQVKGELTAGQSFDAALGAALAAVADDDADADGATNLAELMRGSSPSVADKVVGPAGSLPNPRYRIGKYDPAFAFRRVSTLYCGKSPTYDEMAPFVAAGADDAALKQRIHEKLDSCLRGEYWRTQGLMRLADKRIRPVRAFGKETDIMIGSVRVVIGDYDYDYNLWRHALSDNHDMREMLTAQYHLVPGADGTLQKRTDIIEKPDPNAIAGGQPLPAERRAGLLTTQWFLAYNTMFSSLPRVTGAQAYRAYLGADIASNEGLRPVAGEPIDVDDKGVDNPRCANCHSTLDPLSYPFADYEGVVISITVPFGSFNAGRPKSLMPAWDPARQKASLLGKPVKDLVEWARVAADSDEFKRTIADMFFRQALSRSALPDELMEFNVLWQSSTSDGHSADKMLHRLVDTHAFGSP
jgi:hypothetical protein